MRPCRYVLIYPECLFLRDLQRYLPSPFIPCPRWGDWISGSWAGAKAYRLGRQLQSKPRPGPPAEGVNLVISRSRAQSRTEDAVDLGLAFQEGFLVHPFFRRLVARSSSPIGPRMPRYSVRHSAQCRYLGLCRLRRRDMQRAEDPARSVSPSKSGRRVALAPFLPKPRLHAPAARTGR